MSTPEMSTICKESIKFILTNRSRNVNRFGRNVKCAQTPRKLNAGAAQSSRERGSANAAAAAAAAMQGRSQSGMLFFFHRSVKFMQNVQFLCVFSISSNDEIWYNRIRKDGETVQTCNNCGKFKQAHAPQDMARKVNTMYYITINKLIEIRKPTRRIIMNECAQYIAYVCKEGEAEARKIATITKVNTHKWELKVTGHNTRNAESLNDAIEMLNEMFMYEYEMENAYNGRIKTDAWKW